jgi:hypothetical protein
VKIDLVNGVQPVSVDSVEQTARELAELLDACRAPDATPDLGAHVSALEAAQIAHQIGAGLVALVRHPTADPALLLGVLVTGTTDSWDGVEATSVSEIREVVHGRTACGHEVTFVERVVSVDQLRAGEPFDCQLQAAVADPQRRRLAVFTLSSPSGRGWLALSTLFGQLVSSVDFRD